MNGREIISLLFDVILSKGRKNLIFFSNCCLSYRLILEHLSATVKKNLLVLQAQILLQILHRDTFPVALHLYASRNTTESS